MKIEPKKLQEIFICDAVAGKLFWKERPENMFKNAKSAPPWNAKNARREAFTAKTNGYLCGAIWGRPYKAHHVIFAMHFGRWPSEIDHINGQRADNRIENLREVTRSENGKNQKLHATNKSGRSGVSWCKRQKAWVARITVDGKRRHLGYFQRKVDAAAARAAADIEYGFHRNHGRAQ